MKLINEYPALDRLVMSLTSEEAIQILHVPHIKDNYEKYYVLWEKPELQPDGTFIAEFAKTIAPRTFEFVVL